MSRPELGEGVKVPSKVKDKQFKEVTKQNCQKVTTKSIKSRPGQARRKSSRSAVW